MKTLKSLALLAVTLLIAGSSITITGCKGGGSGSKSDSTSGGDMTIMGGGSSADAPLFSKMFSEYNKNTGIMVNYQSIGSGGGVKGLTDMTLDFGASDATLSDDQVKGMQGAAIHIPITGLAVVVSYNLPDMKDTLMLTPDVIANIFLGNIKKWNDPKIKVLNKNAKLPDLDITIVHRTDGSGTTNIFTSYLSNVNKDWETKVGKGSSVKWPVEASLGGKGNEGVASTLKTTTGAIGYVELSYAITTNMAFAKIQNKANNFITPSIASVTAAANITIPADGKVSINNSEAADGYPISGLSWVIIYKEQKYNNRTSDKATKLLKLVQWMIHDGQQYSPALQYAPLSQNAVTVGDALLKSVTYDGKPVLQ